MAYIYIHTRLMACEWDIVWRWLGYGILQDSVVYYHGTFDWHSIWIGSSSRHRDVTGMMVTKGNHPQRTWIFSHFSASRFPIVQPDNFQKYVKADRNRWRHPQNPIKTHRCIGIDVIDWWIWWKRGIRTYTVVCYVQFQFSTLQL